MTDRALINRAVEAAETAYAPYSKFRVGAALETPQGEVFTGCNVENAALGCTICAERTAVVKAISAGRHDFVRIAIYADAPDYCVPCGACRQVLSEFAPELEVLCVRADGRYVSYRLKNLLPQAFNKDYL